MRTRAFDLSAAEVGRSDQSSAWWVEKSRIIAESPQMLDVKRRLQRIASTEAITLIGGESGTGKELAARAIHYLGGRRDWPFVCINCGALPDGLIESELFGHVRGAYTGASVTREGLIAEAEGGTLFLDEVEETSQHMQVALLRFLQDQAYRPVGSRQVLRANVRVIAASNISLRQLASDGKFRQDLLFRLRLMVVDMPPLRERSGDIPLLVRHFMARLSEQYGCPPKWVAPELMQRLQGQRWPGNVRELENLLHRAFLFSDGDTLQVDPDEFPPEPASLGGLGGGGVSPLACFSAAKAAAVERFERDYVHRVLHESHGNVSAAARRAGKERRAFGKLVKKYGIDMPPVPPTMDAARGAHV